MSTIIMTEKRFIADGSKKRELRKYAGYWFIMLTHSEQLEYPGNSWSGYVLFHKWKWWVKYGEWYGREEGIYHYLDGDRDNIRITNIGVRFRGTDQWA